MLAGGREPIDLIASVQDKYIDDPAFECIIKNPNDYKNFELTKDNLLYLRINGNRVLCIPSIIVSGRSLREIVISEAHTTLAHLGARKTLTYLRNHVWWKGISSDVHAYCETCIVCHQNKSSNQRPYGLLNPLPIPTQPWEAIGIDFIGPLPESKDRNTTFDQITVIIDLLTSMVHLVPSKTTYTARNVAELVFSEVYKHHGLPRAIVSDRDSWFTSIFWTHLNSLIGTQLKMSTAYHPETDGATERANRTVTQMIRICVGSSHKDWVSKLPAIEFAINSARSDSTGYAPFFLNTGRMPRNMIWNAPTKEEFPGVRIFAQRLKTAIMTAHDAILMARVKQTRNANRKRQPVPFKQGDFAYVSTKNMSFPKGTPHKLVPKYVGPYLLLKDYGNFSFKVQLPSHMLRRGIHDVYHASYLRIHHPNDDRRFPGRLYSQVVSDNEMEHETEWAADKIISHAGSGVESIFEVLWHPGDKTWLAFDQVRDLNLLQPYLEAQGVSLIHELPLGTGKPPMDDPQTFLGSIQLPTYKTPLPSLTPRLDPLFPARQLSPSVALPQPHRIASHYRTNHLMSQRPKDHYNKHPLLAARPDGLVQLTSVDPNLVIHPLQLQEYIRFDSDVWRGSATIHSYMPAGYAEFAAAYNVSKGDNPCEFTTWNAETTSYNLDSFPIPPSLLKFAYCDRRYSELRVYNLLKANGEINDVKWEMIKEALDRPHREAVRNQARAESRREEKALKKRRLEEAHPEGFYIGYPKAGSSRKNNRPSRSHKGKEPESPLDRDAEGEDDENYDDDLMGEEPPVA